jgi:LAGLIDADG DNA endonuclease family
MISSEIMNYLTPMSIAFLLIDDGAWVSGSKSVRISTNNFTLQEVELLRDTFKAKFNLDCTIQLLTKKKD